jgi:hypothetical protein
MSLVLLFNRALSAAGVDEGITRPDENSREAALCRTWYDIVRDTVMGAAPWPSLRSYARLALVNERDPAMPWVPGQASPANLNLYQPPSDMLRPYHLQSFAPFRYEGGRISTNEAAPILYYLRRVSDTQQWDIDLLLAVTHGLASYVTGPLTGSSKKIEENYQIAQAKIEDARTFAANLQSEEYEVLPSWMQIRGYGEVGPTKFFYPYAAFNIETSR